jgi:Dyp-type peroxidase family
MSDSDPSDSGTVVPPAFDQPQQTTASSGCPFHRAPGSTERKLVELVNRDRTNASGVFPETPLEPDSRDRGRANKTEAFLGNVQGNILSTTRRGDHVALWLFAFKDPTAHARNCAMVNEAAGRVTTALDQYRNRVKRRFRSLIMTATGLRACGVDPARQDGTTFFPPDGLHHFQGGMRQSGEISWMHDPVRADGNPAWQPHFLKRIDGAWLVAGFSRRALLAHLKHIAEWGDKNGLRQVKVEDGRVWRPRGVLPREAFGYVDGISLPRFFGKHTGMLKMPLEQVFLDSPRHLGCSYLVLRKLDQNVKAFREFAVKESQHAANCVVGRRPNGAPLARDGGHPNTFQYLNDQDGKMCPFTAHIRRANPRLIRDPGIGESQLVRRGVVYGTDRDLKRKGGATGGVGLLFMAYMRNLDTFRTIQAWSHNDDFPIASASKPTDLDFLIHGPPPDKYGQKGPKWITPLGGEYFFVPSLAWMRDLRPEIP